MAEERQIRVLVVEDEPLGAARIAELLRTHVEVALLPVAEDCPSAVEAIMELHPDLVFLDVQMPLGSGIEVVRSIGPAAMPVTVFVTAYGHYALQAFEAAAVDYLLKPYSDERFEEAFRRAKRLLAVGELAGREENLLALLDEQINSEDPQRTDREAGYPERITVHSHGRSRLVPVASIEYITASGVYAELHTSSARYLIRQSLQTLEEQLDPSRFFRVHRSAIVRLGEIDVLHRRSGGIYTAQLKSGARVRVARSRRAELERRLRGG
ncbi:MAG: response regulator [Gemmatimonas sp.]|nr:response regulator [Gemmatimonas sp.]